MRSKCLWVVGMSSLVAAACAKDVRLGPLLPPCTASGDTISLVVAASVGVDPGPISGCMVFPANTSGPQAEYLLVAQAATGRPNFSGSFLLQGATLAAAGAAPALAAQVAPAPLSAADRLHLFLRESERNLAVQMGPSAAFPPRAPTTPLVPDQLGDTLRVKVCGNLDCQVRTMVTVTAIAQKVGTHLAIYVDTLAPPFTQQDLDNLQAVFDGRLYDIDHSAFGVESDKDNNGMVRVVLTQRVNSLCDASSFVFGLFDGRDLIPQGKAGGTGNNSEIFYAIATDPTGAKTCGTPVSAAAVQRIVPPTFAHEFQHMISFNQHYL